MKRALLLSCALATFAVGCEQKPKTEQPTAQTNAAAPAQPVTPPNTATDKAGTETNEAVAQKTADTQDIPTLSDFEDQAEQTITPANMETQLSALDKEITLSEAKPVKKAP